MVDPLHARLARETGITDEQAKKVVEYLRRNRDRLPELDRPVRLAPTPGEKADHLVGLF